MINALIYLLHIHIAGGSLFSLILSVFNTIRLFPLQRFFSPTANTVHIWCHSLLPVPQYCNPRWIRFSGPWVNLSSPWHWHQSCHSFSPGYPLLKRSSSAGSSPYPELRQLSHSQQLKSQPIHSHFHSLILHATAVLFHDIHHQGWPVVLNAVGCNSLKALTEITTFMLCFFSTLTVFSLFIFIHLMCFFFHVCTGISADQGQRSFFRLLSL